MDDVDIVSFQTFILDWYKSNKRDFPWRYIYDPYRVLVSEVLLQQTGAEQIIPYYYRIINEYRSIEELANGDLNFLKDIFRNIGLVYRADRLINISKDILKRYGRIPDSQNQLLSIKGIGKYTCNSVLCFGYNKRYPIVDTNVIRVFKQLLDYESKAQRPHTDKELWHFAEMMLPEEDYLDYNYALLDFGNSLRTTDNNTPYNMFIE